MRCSSCGEDHPTWSSCASWRQALRRVEREEEAEQTFFIDFSIRGYVPDRALDDWKRKHGVAS